MTDRVAAYITKLFSLQGRVAVVTGAARGNGLGIATAVASAGATTWLVDRLEEPLESAASRLAAEGCEVRSLCLDLTEADAGARIVAAIDGRDGRLDVLVNNAGISIGGDPLACTLEAWRRTLAVNVEAAFFVSQAAAGLMRKCGGGSIINLTSLNAEQAFPGNPAYVASKGALKMLGKSLALDLACYGIRVNNLGPGYFRTAMTEASWADEERRAARASRTMLGRWGEPASDLAGTILLLASEAGSYITGQDFYVDGGWLGQGLTPA